MIVSCLISFFSSSNAIADWYWLSVLRSKIPLNSRAYITFCRPMYVLSRFWVQKYAQNHLILIYGKVQERLSRLSLAKASGTKGFNILGSDKYSHFVPSIIEKCFQIASRRTCNKTTIFSSFITKNILLLWWNKVIFRFFAEGLGFRIINHANLDF